MPADNLSDNHLAKIVLSNHELASRIDVKLGYLVEEVKSLSNIQTKHASKIQTLEEEKRFWKRVVRYLAALMGLLGVGALTQNWIATGHFFTK